MEGGEEETGFLVSDEQWNAQEQSGTAENLLEEEEVGVIRQDGQFLFFWSVRWYFQIKKMQ